MKMVKSLLLGSAAGLVAIAGAQAADLPVKAKPVEYVKVCSAYGAGFYYMPGTDTCLKVGGYVYAEYNLNSNGDGIPFMNGFAGQNTRESTHAYNTRFRGFLSLDARTQTEYGTLRSYILLGMEQFSNQNNYANAGAGAGASNGAVLDTTYRGATYFARAFIQFAGITAGKTVSFFDFYDGTLNWQTSSAIGSVTGFGMNLLAYTVQFGGGISASLSLEENEHRRTGLWNANAGTAGDPLSFGIPGQPAPVYGDYAAWRYPDIVGNLRIDQPWGSAQVMGAVHDASAGCAYGATAGATRCLTAAGASNYYGDATGFAVGGGVKFNLPFAQGDTLWLQGIWARGASSYVGFNKNITYDTFAWYNNGTMGAGPGAIGSIALAWALDGVVGTGGNGQVSLTEGYNLFAAVQHYWTPGLRTSIWGGISGVTFPGAAGDINTAKGKFCQGQTGTLVGPGMGANPGTCNPDFSMTQIGSRTIWSPVANLDIGLEVIYSRLDQNWVGNWAVGASGSRPAGAYTATDRDAWTGIFRIQRNFWP